MYIKPDQTQWQGRVDSVDDLSQFRYHQVVKCIELDEIKDGNEYVLLGFSSDEGVKRNKGRVGAVDGPDAFRSAIGSLCWQGDETGFIDVGNITPENGKLEKAQEELGRAVHQLLKRRKKVFVIGGGHETAFGHYLGISGFLKESNPKAKLGILNIDAHFDLREHNGIAHSGSPFLQAHEHAEVNDLDLKYFVYGINRDNNTSSLFKTANELGTEFCDNLKIINSEKESLKRVSEFIQSRTHLYLTICLDVFKASIAPGVSAPAWHGIDLIHALNLIDLVKQSGKLLSADICELNPEFDQFGQTTKTAGSLFSRLIH